ncbi:hypothetical protein ACQ4LE_004012 [Meloidogyne hapla]
MFRLLTLFLFSSNLFILFNLSDAAINLLIVAPNKYYSHFSFHKKIALLLMEQEWVEKVTVIIPLLNQPNEDFHRISLEENSKLAIQYYRINEERQEKNINPNDYMIPGDGIFYDMAENVEWIQSMRLHQFQLGIAELFDPLAFYILRLIGIERIVATSNMPLQSIFYHYLGYLEKIIQKGDIPEMRSTGKNLENQHYFYVHLGLKSFRHYDDKMKEICKNKGYEKIEKFEQIFKNKTHLIVVNHQSFVDFEMPEGYPKKILNVGGIAISDKTNGMSKNEKQALQKAKKKYGLVLVSFGTIVGYDRINHQELANMMVAFNSLKDHIEVIFVWKESEELEAIKDDFGLKNIIIEKKINQVGILAKKQTKIFISHCGINSILEAIKNGVILICVPFFGDQFYNANALAKHGVAIVLDKDENNFYDLGEKIMQIIENESYLNNILEMQAKMLQADPKKTFLDEMRDLVRKIENGQI